MVDVVFDANELRGVIDEAVDAAIKRMEERQPRDGAGAILWTKKQAAKALNASERTIDRWRNQRGLPCVQDGNGKPMFRPEALRKWAADNERILKIAEG